jgi:uncharacterized lipoprotein YmbA
MTFGRISHRRFVAGLALAALLDGCGISPTPRLFTMAARPTPSPAQSSMKVVVKAVEVGKYLDRPQIVRYSDPYELQIAEMERWGEGMRDMTTRVLIENLSQRLPGSQIVADSSPVSLSADVTVEVDISRFDADQTGEITLDARWAVQRGIKRTIIRQERIRFQPASTSITDLVAGMSDALGQLSDHIAQGIAA